MTDLFPALATIYPPEYVLQHEKPFTTSGLRDDTTTATPFAECRVIVHNSKIFVGTDSPSGPRAIFSDTYTQENVFRDSLYTRVLTDSNYLVVFTPSKGCGCGSRLRSWNPYVQSNGIARGSKG